MSAETSLPPVDYACHGLMNIHEESGRHEIAIIYFLIVQKGKEMVYCLPKTIGKIKLYNFSCFMWILLFLYTKLSPVQRELIESTKSTNWIKTHIYKLFYLWCEHTSKKSLIPALILVFTLSRRIYFLHLDFISGWTEDVNCRTIKQIMNHLLNDSLSFSNISRRYSIFL